MRSLITIGESNVPSITTCVYEIHKACPKCSNTSVHIQFVGKGITVLIMERSMTMAEDGFMSHCGACDFEFVQYIPSPTGSIPGELDAVLTEDLKLLLGRIEKDGVFVGTTMTITPDIQLAVERLRKYVEAHS